MKTTSNTASRIERETNFDRHLPMFHGGLIDVAPRLGDNEPAQPVNRLTGAFDGVVHGIFNGGGGSAGEFNDLVDMIFHGRRNIPDFALAATEPVQKPRDFYHA